MKFKSLIFTLLLFTLAALPLRAQEGVELEIIIVDNCSREDDALAVEQLAKAEGCTFIAAKENRGYNAGNNLGLRYATGRGDRIQKVIFDI